MDRYPPQKKCFILHSAVAKAKVNSGVTLQTYFSRVFFYGGDGDGENVVGLYYHINYDVLP